VIPVKRDAESTPCVFESAIDAIRVIYIGGYDFRASVRKLLGGGSRGIACEGPYGIVTGLISEDRADEAAAL